MYAYTVDRTGLETGPIECSGHTSSFCWQTRPCPQPAVYEFKRDLLSEENILYAIYYYTPSIPQGLLYLADSPVSRESVPGRWRCAVALERDLPFYRE